MSPRPLADPVVAVQRLFFVRTGRPLPISLARSIVAEVIAALECRDELALDGPDLVSGAVSGADGG